LALRDLAEVFELTPEVLQARFLDNAPLLASQAGERALADAQNSPADIDAVIVSTCTGYLCPGLTSYVGERLGLRANVLALDLVGQGCGAALPWLGSAVALACGAGASEVSSAAFDDAAVFVDGAAWIFRPVVVFAAVAAGALTAVDIAASSAAAAGIVDAFVCFSDVSAAAA